jgi:hypothetical protein
MSVAESLACRHCGEPIYLCTQGCCTDDDQGGNWIHFETEALACELPGPLLTAEPPDEAAA